MKKLLILLALILAIVSATTTAQEKEEPWLNEEELTEYLENALEKTKLPGFAISIVSKDEVLYSRGFGYADVEGKRIVTPETLFYLGSVSKSFTAALVASLVEEGTLDWDAPVINYLPSLRLFDNYVEEHANLADLMSHRTGLPRHELIWYRTDRTREELIDALDKLENSAPYRAKYQYNNLMFVLAGYIAGHVSDSTYEALLQQRILNAIGMKESLIDFNAFKEAANRAIGYAKEDDKNVAADYVNLNAMAPAGGIFSNLNDMNKYMQMLLNMGEAGETQVLSENSVKKLFTPQTLMAGYPGDEKSVNLGYCLGWVAMMHKGAYVVNHGGAIDGFTSLVYILPHRGLGITILTNRSAAASYNDAIGARIIDLFLGEKPKDYLQELLMAEFVGEGTKEEKEVSTLENEMPPTHELSAYVGKYHNEAYGTVSVKLRDGKLVESYSGSMEYELEHRTANHFAVNAGGIETTLEFEVNRDGVIDAIEAKLEPTLPPYRFEKEVSNEFSSREYLEQFTGDYFIAVQNAEFSINGAGDLILNLPGQPTFTLEPIGENKFKLADVPVDIQIIFSKEDSDVFNVATFIQPNGTYKAKRGKAKEQTDVEKEEQ